MEKETSIAAPSSEAAQPSNTSTPTRALRFCCKSWKSKALEVLDSDTGAVVYTIDTKFRKPHLVFQIGDGGAEFGSAVYHTLSTTIDLTINGQPVELKLKKILGSSYTYASPAFGNNVMTWQSSSKWSSIDYVLVNEKAEPVARYSAPYWKMDFSGKLEFVDSKVDNEEARQEIIATGFALIYYMMVNIALA